MDTGDRVDSPYRNGERIYCYYQNGYNQDTTFNFQYKINGMVSKYLDIGIVNWVLSPSTDVSISNLSVNITFEETLTNEYVNMMQAGIVDPVKVTRTALESAASVAGLLLTTECIIGIEEDPEPPAPMQSPMGHMPM